MLSITLPPLHDCCNDLPEISPVCSTIKASGDFGNPRITPSALSALARDDRPGNVRQLHNVLERALIL